MLHSFNVDAEHDGTMVVLTSLLYEGTIDPPIYLDSNEQQENGIDVHAGEWETSQTLFLHPGSVHDDYRTAVPVTATSMDALSEIAERSGWQGYFGSPRLASADAGARMVDYRTKLIIELALRVMDGFEWRSLPTRADLDGANSSLQTVDDNTLARSDEERRRQEEWIRNRR